jgi:hypothetical protein
MSATARRCCCLTRSYSRNDRGRPASATSLGTGRMVVRPFLRRRLALHCRRLPILASADPGFYRSFEGTRQMRNSSPSKPLLACCQVVAERREIDTGQLGRAPVALAIPAPDRRVDCRGEVLPGHNALRQPASDVADAAIENCAEG